ncbi:hypothetical protein CGZ98_01870 [Enemella evansiae]|uniref:DUF4232 domain-containing protein n=1 Tax=Enemella evansiae TaxID=2016499 RepID=UPI000B96B90A|nr:DUF4232 domain-containing protein [Enemella evansiae]OYO02783.1 hypothetical protein CGZ95_05525 [Enemella evansiae]OYO15206.1 hypothetical protein CGZ98_01870 [Enemella evansiae]OYO20274.1 hypothetical protein BI335_01570 [Enemella evansiae]
MVRPIALLSAAAAGLALAGSIVTAAPAGATEPYVPPCTSDTVNVQAVYNDGGMNKANYRIQVGNPENAPRSCSMVGFPGVDHAGPGAETIGAPAGRKTWQPVQRLILAPGETAYAELTITNTGPFDPESCQAVESRGLQVWLPNTYDYTLVDLPHRACANPELTLMSVGPMQHA